MWYIIGETNLRSEKWIIDLYIAEKIAIEGVSREEIESCLAVPPANDLGDYTLPCFRFSKLLKKSPAAIAEELRAAIPTDGVLTEVTAVNAISQLQNRPHGLCPPA